MSVGWSDRWAMWVMSSRRRVGGSWVAAALDDAGASEPGHVSARRSGETTASSSNNVEKYYNVCDEVICLEATVQYTLVMRIWFSPS